MAATVRLPGQKKLLRAEVLHIEPRVDPATGARDVRLGMIDAVSDAPAGLTVTVNLVIETRARAISVPRSAILQAGDGATVRIVGADDVVRDRAVRFVDWPAERVIVTGGIKAGERVLVDPAAARPGETVRPSGAA
jgi:HlyD family secretion protein